MSRSEILPEKKLQIEIWSWYSTVGNGFRSGTDFWLAGTAFTHQRGALVCWGLKKPLNNPQCIRHRGRFRYKEFVIEKGFEPVAVATLKMP